MTRRSALHFIAVRYGQSPARAVNARLLRATPGGAAVPIAGVVSSTLRISVLAQKSGESNVLWEGERGDPDRAPDLVPIGKDGLLCLVPGRSLMRIAEHNGVVRSEEMNTTKGLPERIFAVADAVYGLFEAKRGGARIARLRARSGAVATEKLVVLPHMDEPSRISGVAIDARGRMVVTADNDETGFQLWRQDDAGGWSHLIADGAARFGFNAAVYDLVAWGNMMALAVGSSHQVRSRMFGIRVSSEILVLMDDGRCEILCGEARASPSGLKVPLAGAANAAAREIATHIKLAVDGDRLIAAMQRDETAARIYSVAPTFNVGALDDFDGLIGGFDTGSNDGNKTSVIVLKH